MNFFKKLFGSKKKEGPSCSNCDSGNASISKSDMMKALSKAGADYKIAALTKKQEKILYDIVNNVDEIEDEYIQTVLSPKKFFFPKEEVFFDYTAEGDITPKYNAEPLVLFGIRPCDINGMKILHESTAKKILME